MPRSTPAVLLWLAAAAFSASLTVRAPAVRPEPAERQPEPSGEPCFCGECEALG